MKLFSAKILIRKRKKGGGVYLQFNIINLGAFCDREPLEKVPVCLCDNIDLPLSIAEKQLYGNLKYRNVKL